MSGTGQNLFKGKLRTELLGNGKHRFRLYPWRFSNDPVAEVVCEITFETQSIDRVLLAKFEGSETDVEVSNNQIFLFDWDCGDEYQFTASSILQRMVPYELSDFVEAVAGLEVSWELEYNRAHVANSKLVEVEKLATELIRRSEVKATASEERAKTEGEVIKALKRILVAIDSTK